MRVTLKGIRRCKGPNSTTKPLVNTNAKHLYLRR